MPEKELNQGVIEVYIHPNKKIGALIELRCETDFVARTEEFRKLAHEICLQVAAMNPLFLKPEDIPEEFLDGERKIYKKQFSGTGKPKKIIEEIVEGKIEKYRQEVSLLTQPWIRDESKSIGDFINEYIGKVGENIVIEKFVRYQI